MGPPSATLYLPDDADLLAFAKCPGVNINYVMKNVMLVFGTEVYNTALQLMGEDDPIDVYDVPKDVYQKAIRVSAARIQRHKSMETDKDRELIWKTRTVFIEGFCIPVPKEIPGNTLEDVKIHCYLSQKKEQVAVRLWNELGTGQKSAFIKMLIRTYMERPVIEPRFFTDKFHMKKSGSVKGTNSLKTREWVKKEPVKKGTPGKRGRKKKTEEPVFKTKSTVEDILEVKSGTAPLEIATEEKDVTGQTNRLPEPVPEKEISAEIRPDKNESEEFDLFGSFMDFIQ